MEDIRVLEGEDQARTVSLNVVNLRKRCSRRDFKLYLSIICFIANLVLLVYL